MSETTAPGSLADLEAIERLISTLPEEKLQELASIPGIKERTGRWTPNPGPQKMAYESKADCLLYGGEPGGGKSQLILGLSFNEHRRSFIMRREYGDLERLIEDALTINKGRDGFNGSPPPRLKLANGRVIYFRAAHRVGDEQGTMGQGRDLLGIDEASQFAESQVRFLMGWVRTEIPGQRCRTILATNPPLSPSTGAWLPKMFAPWLDDTWPDHAEPGELRWVVSDEEGKDLWVSGPKDKRKIGGKTMHPTSRTFIPASTKDNPYYVDTAYERQLDSMPEPYRSLLMGGFKAEFKDDENQLIPTMWIRAAMARWDIDGWKEYDMTAMALDPAGGGKDEAVLAWRHQGWFAPLVALKGEDTIDGSAMAASVIKNRRAQAPIVVDMGGGWGGDVTLRLKENGIQYQAFNGANKSTAVGMDGIRFVNMRAEAWWKFRQELNPDQEGGSIIALPDDPELLADLASPKFEPRAGGIQLESKDNIRKRLGRSTDRGDAVVMCLAPGNQATKREVRSRRSTPVVKTAYANAKRHLKQGKR